MQRHTGSVTSVTHILWASLPSVMISKMMNKISKMVTVGNVHYQNKKQIPLLTLQFVFLGYSLQIKSSAKKSSCSRFRYMWTSLAPSGMSSWNLKSTGQETITDNIAGQLSTSFIFYPTKTALLDFDVSPGDCTAGWEPSDWGLSQQGYGPEMHSTRRLLVHRQRAKQHPGGPLVRFWRKKQKRCLRWGGQSRCSFQQILM